MQRVQHGVAIAQVAPLADVASTSGHRGGNTTRRYLARMQVITWFKVHNQEDRGALGQWLRTNSNLSAVVGIRQQQGHRMFEPNWLSAKHSGALLIKTKRSSNKQPEADFRNLLS